MSVSEEILLLLQEHLRVKDVWHTTACNDGYINDGTICKTDVGDLFFKFNPKPEAIVMFKGEEASLEAIRDTGIIQVPQPIKIIEVPSGGYMFVTSVLDMRPLDKYATQLGTDLARLHLHNSTLKPSGSSSSVHVQGGGGHVDQFGFHSATCCGFLPQDNTWSADWVEFYTRKLQRQMDRVEEKYGDREVLGLWSAVVRHIPGCFTGVQVTPSLLHGDLWYGNKAETEDGPVLFDPASFYGHSEHDLAIAHLFGGFPSEFWDAYFAVIPKAPGFDKRQPLYKLWHYLNHWNHFGKEKYRKNALSMMHQLAEG